MSFGLLFAVFGCGQTESDSFTEDQSGSGAQSGTHSGGLGASGGETQVGSGGTPTEGAGGYGSMTSDAEHPAVGAWQLFGFEDPLRFVIEEVHADKVLGSGGFDLLQTGSSGSIAEGWSDGNELFFLFAYSPDFPVGAGMALQFHLFVSDDGERMAGTIQAAPDGVPIPLNNEPSYRVALLPVPSGHDQFPSQTRPELGELASVGPLHLVQGPEDSGEFRMGDEYSFFARTEWIAGEIGAYHESEMTFPPAAGGPIVVGPIAETAPGHPIEIRISFDNQDPPQFESLWARTAVSSYLFEPGDF